MSVGGGVVDHGLVFVSKRRILAGEGPAFGFDTGLGGGACGVGVEVIGVGEVGDIDASAGGDRTEFKGDVIDVVAAVVASLT